MNDTPKPRRRWYQFSRGTLVLFLVVVTVGLGQSACWLVSQVEQTREECEERKRRAAEEAIQATVKAIEKFGGNCEWKEGYGVWFDGSNFSDAGLEYLKALPKLEVVCLKDAPITDAGLEHLKGLTKLKKLSLTRTKVTDEGVRKFQRALPGLRIVR